MLVAVGETPVNDDMALALIDADRELRLQSIPASPFAPRPRGRGALVERAGACAETYSVLTRLPGDARLAPADAARLDSRARGTYEAVGVQVIVVT